MDMKMKAETMSSAGTEWDCKVVDGLVEIITDDDEDLQCATIGAFLIQGTVPQLPEAGVPWTDYLTKKITFGELDFYIRDSLEKVEKPLFYPGYSIENDSLRTTIGKYKQEGTI